ncbi:LEF-9 [Aratus pisonii nudivirus]|nr:LEF-9 [Aratus pisonii nudivirus]
MIFCLCNTLQILRFSFQVEMDAVEEKSIYTSTPNNSNSIKFISYLSSIQQPIFPSLVYCVQPTTTNNVLTLCNKELSTYLQSNKNFYICRTHGLLSEKNIDCMYCSLFNDFTYVFIIKTKYHYLTFPPPKWYSAKVLNFLKTFCFNSLKYTQRAKCCNVEKNAELNSYIMFINMGFTEGNIRALSTGKTSYIRNNILGFHTFGGRATLSIDATLSPQYAILPQHIFDNLNLATPLVILNRAPSLKNTCIYAVEVLRNSDPTDYTIRMNSYITEGLHADQDGDELSLFYIKHPGKDEPSHDIQMAITELKRFSWNGGVRHDFSFKPRYEFTQYLKYILYIYNDYFCENNSLWASIPGTVEEKCKIMMHLGCSIYKKEIDTFIFQLSNFVSQLKPQLATSKDLLSGSGSIEAVIKSGAKGEQIHIETYKRHLYNLNKNRKTEMINNFNKYIESGSQMSLLGAYQFIFLEAVNPLTMLSGHVYYNDKILMKDIIHSTAFASYCYNDIACKYTFTNLAADEHNNISDAEVEEYLNSII